MSGLGYDADGDIDMSPPPVFEFIKAPRLAVWSQPALVQYMRDRRQYETKMRERCATTGEVYERVVASVKSSIEPRVLDHLAHYVLKKDVFEVTDADLCTEISRKAGKMMNDHVPDVEQLVAAHLKMDMREPDVEARVSKFFMDFDRIVDDHGLSSIIGRGPAADEDGRQRLKTRCKLLVDHIQPAVLRVDVERLVSLTHRHVKTDDVALYELIVGRGRRQQHFHQIQGEVKRDAAPARKTTTQAAGSDKPVKAKNGGPPTAAKTNSQKETREPPRGLRDCPVATPEQKEAVRQRLTERKHIKAERIKMMRSGEQAVGQRAAFINDVLEVSLCPDTGADCNVLSAELVEELCELDSTVIRIQLEPPVRVELAGGVVTYSNESITIDARIVTAAGPLHLRNVRCLVLEGHDNELLLGEQR